MDDMRKNNVMDQQDIAGVSTPSQEEKFQKLGREETWYVVSWSDGYNSEQNVLTKMAWLRAGEINLTLALSDAL